MYTHAPSLLTHPHYSHTLTTHTLSLLTHPHYSHTLTTHAPSLLTHPHYSRTLTTHAPSLLTQHHYSHTVTTHTHSLLTHRHTVSPCTEGDYKPPNVQQCINEKWVQVNCTCPLISDTKVTTDQQPNMATTTPGQSSNNTQSAQNEQISAGLQATPIPYPHPSEDIFRYCLPIQSIYFSVIPFLLILTILLGLGWAHTFIVLKLKIKKLKHWNKKHELIKTNQGLPGNPEAVETIALAKNPYERMVTTSLTSDYHLLDRPINNHQPSTPQLPPDYEYNKLEKVESNPTSTVVATASQETSSDYDHIHQEPTPPRNAYHTLEGPLVPDPNFHPLQLASRRTDHSYHVLESPGLLVRPQSHDMDYSMLESPRTTRPVIETRVEVDVHDDRGISDSQKLVRNVSRNDYHVLEGPLPNPANKRNNYHILEGPAMVGRVGIPQQTQEIRKPAVNQVLERPRMIYFRRSVSESNIFERSRTDTEHQTEGDYCSLQKETVKTSIKKPKKLEMANTDDFVGSHSKTTVSLKRQQSNSEMLLDHSLDRSQAQSISISQDIAAKTAAYNTRSSESIGSDYDELEHATHLDQSFTELYPMHTDSVSIDSDYHALANASHTNT